MMYKSLRIIAIFLCCFALSFTKVGAQTVIFRDDFENLDNWSAVYGQMELWQIIDGAVYATLPKSFSRAEITPNIDWNYSWQHYQISFDYYVYSGADRNINFGFTDANEWYGIQFVAGNYYIRHVVDGRGVWVENGPYGMSLGRKYRFKLELNAGRIIVTIDGVQLLDKIDPTYSGSFGRPTLAATTGSVFPTKVSFDNFEVKLLSGIETPIITEFKQNDPKWGLAEYDSAQNWSDNPTIANWGCALTSLAMILDYHGINKLPDNTDLDPETLNNWLKSQPDGYIADGLVNWAAAMRLTRDMSGILGTPKLEYKRHNADPLIAATDQINLNQPVVMQIPGHFMVGHGLDDQEIIISDPAYSYSKFSQHNTSLLSTRSFTPSNTDLSHIMLVHNPDLSVQFEHEQDQYSVFMEFLESDDHNLEQSSPVIIHEIAKPDSGKFELTVSSDQFQDFETEIFLYDVEADVKKLVLGGKSGPIPQKFIINYDKDSLESSEIISLYTFSDLLEKLETAHISSSIDYPAYFYLHRIFSLASEAELNNAQNYHRYTSLLLEYLEIYEQLIDSDTNLFLYNYLNMLEQQFAANQV